MSVLVALLLLCSVSFGFLLLKARLNIAGSWNIFLFIVFFLIKSSTGRSLLCECISSSCFWWCLDFLSNFLRKLLGLAWLRLWLRQLLSLLAFNLVLRLLVFVLVCQWFILGCDGTSCIASVTLFKLCSIPFALAAHVCKLLFLQRDFLCLQFWLWRISADCFATALHQVDGKRGCRLPNRLYLLFLHFTIICS